MTTVIHSGIDRTLSCGRTGKHFDAVNRVELMFLAEQ